MNLEAIWTPHPKQELFLSCPVYEVMFGGAKGPGKSDALLFDHVKQHQIVHKRFTETGMKTGASALIIRKAFGRLMDLINRAHRYFPVLSRDSAGHPMMRWREQEHTWYCACGYRVRFGHLEGPQDHQIYQGQETSWLGVDQVEEIPYEQYAYLKLQVRCSDPILPASEWRVRCTANPLGKYADWVKARFVAPARDGWKIVSESMDVDIGAGLTKTVTRERVFIPATLLDNPSLPPEYAAELMSAPDHMRRAYLYGDWDVTPGSFFGDVWDPKLHIIDDMGPDLIRIPSNWPVWRCGDWGSRAPSACYWLACDNDGLLIVLDELYGPGENPRAWAEKIAAVEEKWGWLDNTGRYSKLQGYLDPSAFKTDTHGGKTIAEDLFESGIGWWEGDNSRKQGWKEIRARLMERGGVSGKIPGLRVARRCRNLIRTLPNLTSPENESIGDMDDIDTKQEDHGADALRYGVMSRPIARTKDQAYDEEVKQWERLAMARQVRADAQRNEVTGY